MEDDSNAILMVDAAQKLGIEYGTIHAMMREGKLRSSKVDGRRYVSLADVERLLAEGYRPRRHKRKETAQRKDARVLGAKEAQAFEIFRRGGTWHEVVIACKVPADLASDFWRHYRMGPGAIVRERQETEAQKLIQKSFAEQLRHERFEARLAHGQKIAEMRTRSPAPIVVERGKVIQFPERKDAEAAKTSSDPVHPSTSPADPALRAQP